MPRTSSKAESSPRGIKGLLHAGGGYLTGALLVVIVGTLAAAGPAMSSRLQRKHAEAVAAGLLPAHPTVAITWPTIPGVVAADGSPASWLDSGTRAQLTTLLQNTLTTDPADDASLRAAADALVATGWAAKVDAIRREPGNTVRIAATWRPPAALVRAGEKDYLVSTGGERLDRTFPAGSFSGMKVVVGAPTAVPESLGEAWSGPGVAAGLQLLGYLQNTDAFGQVWGVDVSEYAKHKRLSIITDHNTRILWGAAPGDWKPGEPPHQTKLKWLLELRNSPKYGRRIDASQALVDLTVPRGPLGMAPVGDSPAIADSSPTPRKEPTKPASGKPTGPKSARGNGGQR